MKAENDGLLSEGNYPAFNSQNTAGISNEASDPLATDDLVSVLLLCSGYFAMLSAI